jgi:hypothetical protein
VLRHSILRLLVGRDQCNHAHHNTIVRQLLCFLRNTLLYLHRCTNIPNK